MKLKQLEKPIRTLWSDDCLVGFSEMDSTHEEFFSVTRQLLICNESNAARALTSFIEHAIQHFDQENSWMTSTGFPATECHIAEHNDVLESAQDLKKKLDTGEARLEAIHAFGIFLFRWFPQHIDYLDSALAAWMCKIKMGGKPLIFRRSVPGSDFD